MDRVSKEIRSRNMSRIRSKNTLPEILLRKALFREKIRYRLHVKELPGKPDIVIKKYKLVIEVRGCFWHGHEKCKKGHIPKSNTKFWEGKIKRNKERDRINEKLIVDLGFKYIPIWECEIVDVEILKVIVEGIRKHINSF